MAMSNLPSGLCYWKGPWLLRQILVKKLINTVQKVSRRTVLCIRGQDNPLTFNKCVSYFDNFKLSGLSR